MSKMMKRVAVAALLLTAAVPAFAAETAAPVVQVEQGRVSGVVTGDVAAFKGIPFAAPPVGSLRWRPPQPAAAWAGVRSGAEYGADCMQKPLPGDAAPLGVAPAEDCLYLNVWAPADTVKPGAKRPVMVWIYGGGFVNGGSSPAVYDGSNFARDGVVLVSFNYRVGRFGFFAHPALSAEAGQGPTGNFGYLDQLAALQWVKRNIAAFGGDPDNVTVFGESAGGISVHMLLTSPLAKGLFNRGIIQSGAGRDRILPTPPLRAEGDAPSGEKAGVAYAAQHGISDTGAAGLAALRALPADTVVDGLNMATMNTPTYSGPMVDGAVVRRSSAVAAYAAGEGADVPVMVGATGADGFFFGGSLDDVLAPFGADKDKALALFDPDGSRDVKLIGHRVAGAFMFIEPARETARLLSAHKSPVYLFRYSYVAESMRKEWWGTPHATEIPFVFDTVKARYGDALTVADAAAAKAAHAYWVAFAKTGKPEPQGLPAWTPFKAGQDERLMDFGTKGPVLEVDPMKDRLDLAQKVAEQRTKAASN
ncbi:carboxylesterase/lipase family protein [Nitrospirillum sp. BR 11163]|uniref:carboxylesterase/lipase family protein n=1 Tax=Nitrospirillum sp. BR 11163 TaxID=3104323 RepID=UPI002AFDEECB|nr:carboxylesterase family protein [Nitrospirillum sp. BR 11163]MEA1675028.1 carboxylesterase family protein [Nitrospirillum sp. BR 11163]